jgi:four helix bundle protein
MQNSIIKQKSYDFALRIIKLHQFLREQKHFEIAAQLVKSATSIGANVEEALAGQSKKDFVGKMGIASKEARETNYWLRLIRDSGLVRRGRVEKLIASSEELLKILTSIVKTSVTKLRAETKN